jgi:hypothetical protein
MAGGAPLRITDCGPLAGCPGTTVVQKSAIERLRTYPTKGTFLRAAETGFIYRVAGGAPLRITDVSAIVGWRNFIFVNQLTISRHLRLRAYPTNRTFIRGAETGIIYRIAGGTPFRISYFAPISGWRHFTTVNQLTIDRFDHLRPFPVNGTVLRAADTGRVYKIVPNGAIRLGYCTSSPYGCPNAVNVNQKEIDQVVLARFQGKNGTALGDFLILLVVGIGCVALVFLSATRPLATVSVLLAVYVITRAVRDTFDPLLHLEHAYPGSLLGTVTFYSADVVAAALLTVGVYRLITQGLRNRAQGLAAVFLLLAAVYIARGVFTYGFQAAVNQGRPPLYFLAPLVYAATVPSGWDKRVWRLLAVASLSMVATAFVFYAIDGFHPSSEMVLRNGVPVSSRPIAATGALVILEAAIVLFVLRWPSRRVGVLLAIVSAAGVVALQHRTVWAAGIAIGFVALGIWVVKQTRESRTRALAAIGGLFVAVPLAVWGFFQSGTLVADVKEITRSDSTLRWRIDGWKDLIAANHSPTDVVIGRPAGSNWERTINHVATSVSPHDYYVELFLRFGVLGLLILFILYAMLWKRRDEFASKVGLTPAVVGLLLLTQLTYYVPYSPDLAQGLIVGVFVGSLPADAHNGKLRIFRKRRERADSELPTAP